MLSEAREMVIEALDFRFRHNVSEDVHKKIKALNNRILLRKLFIIALESKDIDEFMKHVG